MTPLPQLPVRLNRPPANAGPLFTVADMLSLQRETVEWAAALCESLTRKINNGGERYTQPAIASECAAAIREALK